MGDKKRNKWTGRERMRSWPKFKEVSRHLSAGTTTTMKSVTQSSR